MKMLGWFWVLLMCGFLSACGGGSEGGGTGSGAVQGITMPAKVSAVTAD